MLLLGRPRCRTGVIFSRSSLLAKGLHAATNTRIQSTALFAPQHVETELESGILVLRVAKPCILTRDVLDAS